MVKLRSCCLHGGGGETRAGCDFFFKTRQIVFENFILNEDVDAFSAAIVDDYDTNDGVWQS